MKTPKKIPQRMCVVCRTMKDKNSLFRFVAQDGVCSLDESGKRDGRGFYICKDEKCLEKASKNKNFAKQFGFTMSVDVVNQLKEKLN